MSWVMDHRCHASRQSSLITAHSTLSMLAVCRAVIASGTHPGPLNFPEEHSHLCQGVDHSSPFLGQQHITVPPHFLPDAATLRMLSSSLPQGIPSTQQQALRSTVHQQGPAPSCAQHSPMQAVHSTAQHQGPWQGPLAVGSTVYSRTHPHCRDAAGGWCHLIGLNERR